MYQVRAIAKVNDATVTLPLPFVWITKQVAGYRTYYTKRLEIFPLL
jgi:hypothetical protein